MRRYVRLVTAIGRAVELLATYCPDGEIAEEKPTTETQSFPRGPQSLIRRRTAKELTVEPGRYPEQSGL
jgi:hypothetical protein